MATLSDSIGRQPLFVLAATVDAVTNTISALALNNVVYVVMMVIQGGGDNSMAVGMALIADYVVSCVEGCKGSGGIGRREEMSLMSSFEDPEVGGVGSPRLEAWRVALTQL